MKIKDLINGRVTYDKDCQYFWVNTPKGGVNMLAMMRGWGHIQNMFKDENGLVDFDEAEKYQDKIGEFIAEAINEKIKNLIE